MKRTPALDRSERAQLLWTLLVALGVGMSALWNLQSSSPVLMSAQSEPADLVRPISAESERLPAMAGILSAEARTLR